MSDKVGNLSRPGPPLQARCFLKSDDVVTGWLCICLRFCVTTTLTEFLTCGPTTPKSAQMILFLSELRATTCTWCGQISRFLLNKVNDENLTLLTLTVVVLCLSRCVTAVSLQLVRGKLARSCCRAHSAPRFPPWLLCIFFGCRGSSHVFLSKVPRYIVLVVLWETILWQMSWL